MEYIEKTLGLRVTLQPWEHERKMPYYIQDKFEIQKAALGSVAALFLYPKTAEVDRIAALQKHIARIQKAEKIPVVLVLVGITKYRRDALIDARIPFVVPNKQLYLPFVGTCLQERYDQETVPAETFQPATQVLFFYYLYQDNEDIYMSEAVKDLGYSAMTISRAARQLIQTGYFTERKAGVQKILSGTLGKKELFERIRPLLINPVRRRTSVKKTALTDQLLLAGDTAIAKKTMISDSTFFCYAVAGKEKLPELPYAMDAKTEVVVEVWKYDPKLLSSDGMVDPLSLIMSFEDSEDERIQDALEELLESLWEE